MTRTAAFAILSLLSVRGALTCSCTGPTPVCSVYSTTSVLFLGHVVRIEHVYDEPPGEMVVDGKKIGLIGPGQNLVHFDVTKSYRGAPGNRRSFRLPTNAPPVASNSRKDTTTWFTLTRRPMAALAPDAAAALTK